MQGRMLRCVSVTFCVLIVAAGRSAAFDRGRLVLACCLFVGSYCGFEKGSFEVGCPLGFGGHLVAVLREV